MNLRHYLEFGVQTAYEAGRLTLGYFGTRVARPEFKADDTPVTVADREAERLIRERIAARYPKHAVLGEEYGEAEGSGTDYRWVVDPIDGTKSYVRGVPLYGVLIGLEIEGVCEVGAAYFPAIDEMVYAATGEGCYLNGRRTPGVENAEPGREHVLLYRRRQLRRARPRRGLGASALYNRRHPWLVGRLRPRPRRHGEGGPDARPHHEPLGLRPLPA